MNSVSLSFRHLGEGGATCYKGRLIQSRYLPKSTSQRLVAPTSISRWPELWLVLVSSSSSHWCLPGARVAHFSGKSKFSVCLSFHDFNGHQMALPNVIYMFAKLQCCTLRNQTCCTSKDNIMFVICILSDTMPRQNWRGKLLQTGN